MNGAFSTTTEVLRVEELSLEYRGPLGFQKILQSVSFAIGAGEIFGLVGESGCGKSTVIFSILGFLRSGGRITNGRVWYRGKSIFDLPPAQLSKLRGRSIGFVPQNPSAALSPHLRIVDQITELLLQHDVAGSYSEAKSLALEQLTMVALPEPEVLARKYPHELSGGQQQRVCIAMAIACKPDLLLLDEPTTGLDVTTQAKIVKLLLDLRRETGVAMLYVTHDLGVLSMLADRLGVMYAGHLVEVAPAGHFFKKPRHPYSRGLIASIPSLHGVNTAELLTGVLRRQDLAGGCPFTARCKYASQDCATKVQILELAEKDHFVACWRWRNIPAMASPTPAGSESLVRLTGDEPILQVTNLDVVYSPPKALGAYFSAPPPGLTVSNINFEIRRGEVLALVGESGSGKTTIARSISGLVRMSAGEIRFNGGLVPPASKARSQELRRKIQYIFQNPDASLNPRARIWRILSRPLRTYFALSYAEAERQIGAILEEVQLGSSYLKSYPSQLSGGEKQRIAIARALVASPDLLLCDEILSALDVSVQASVIEVLKRIRRETGVAMLFISHDLAVVRQLSDRVAVLFRGQIVEIGPTERVFESPQHSYTRQLLNSVPDIYEATGRRIVSGAVPSRAVGHDHAGSDAPTQRADERKP